MAQGFYSLEEAANILGITPDELNQMAQHRTIRAFADRGTWRFRTQDIEGVAKQRGLSTPAPAPKPGGEEGLSLNENPLLLDEPVKPQSGLKPKTDVKSKSKLDDDLIPVDDIFGADLDTLGQNSGLDEPGPSPISSPAPLLADEPVLRPTSAPDPLLGGDDDDDDAVLLGGEASPSSLPPTRMSGGQGDSSGRLIMEQSSFEFELTDDDGGFNLGEEPKRKSELKGSSSGRLTPVLAPGSGDNDARLDFEPNVGAADDGLGLSLEGDSPPGGGPLLTEEIDLDAEQPPVDEAAPKPKSHTTKAYPPRSAPQPSKTQAPPQARGTMLPESSPFELSADDLGESKTSISQNSQNETPMGSEFELTLAPEEEALSPLSLGDDEDVDLGDLPPASETGSGPRAELSGINLHDPADSGISLEEDEEADDSISFDLTLDEGDTGPKTIKGSLPPDEQSDSEFELTLDGTPAASSSPSLTAGGAASGEKDIFETDFDLPALDDESASQAVALDEADTDLESSDFDLAVDDGSADRASGSQVVAVEEDAGLSAGDQQSVDELLLEEEEQSSAYADLDDEEEEEEAVATIPAAEAEWGILPLFLMACSVLIMFVAGLMAFELLHGINGYHTASRPGGVMVRLIAGVFTDDLPKE